LEAQNEAAIIAARAEQARADEEARKLREQQQ